MLLESDQDGGRRVMKRWPLIVLLLMMGMGFLGVLMLGMMWLVVGLPRETSVSADETAARYVPGLMSIPWKREAREPAVITLAPARTPWDRLSAPMGRMTLPLARTPWVRDADHPASVRLAPAAVPAGWRRGNETGTAIEREAPESRGRP